MTGTKVSEMSRSNRHDDIVHADEKIALLEYARIGDVLSAEQDAVAKEAYLGGGRGGSSGCPWALLASRWRRCWPT